MAKPRFRFARNLIYSCSRTRKTSSSRSTQHQTNEFSVKNGALLVEELIRISNGNYNPFRVFSEHELEQATNKFDQDLVLFTDANYRLYQGMLENRTVLVKKMIEEEDDGLFLDYCVREIAVAAYVSTNRNLVKILGCCLESKVPVLVFEYTPNGNLSAYLSRDEMLLPWRTRIRIAAQVADAVAYLHLGKSRPLIHRHVKTENVLLDENLNAKLFDFGLSLEVPDGEMYVEAEVEGTVGFVAPESVATGKFNEKTDVFAFGATLLELLTGREPLDVFMEASSLAGSDKCAQQGTRITESSVMSVSLPTRRDLRLFLKENVVKDEKLHAIQASAELAVRCVEALPEKRPTIEEVAKLLRQIKNM